jgi:hypothetical protein
MFKSNDELTRYVAENYPEVTDYRIDDDHWDLECTQCKIVRGFQVVRRIISGSVEGVIDPHEYTRYKKFESDFSAPITYLFRCPVCKSFKHWIVYERMTADASAKLKLQVRRFKVTSVPSEGLENIDELPEDPPALRIAYRQAIRSMDANAHLAAAAMFRRALQVITRQILGAPDKNPDLLDFSPQDADDLQSIFMELVSDLFVIPAAMAKARLEFLARRKISPQPQRR